MNEAISKAVAAIRVVPIMSGTYALDGEDAAAVARAVIAAIREPTEAMLDAAVPEGGHWEDASPDTVFRAMVDAALT